MACARSRDITRVADAPSDSCDELPAVMLPLSDLSNTGESFSRPSSVVSARLHSSCSTSASSSPTGLPVFLSRIARRTWIGAISSLKKPSFWPRAVRCWLASDSSSYAWRVML
jgi:hypothetical protein